MFRILFGVAFAAAAYRARRRGLQIHLPWGDGCGTLGLHLDDQTYLDFYRSFGNLGMFWCSRDEDGRIVERGWLNLGSGAWRIESVNGEAVGRWGYLRRCRRLEVA